jgi:hypothetical protein
MTTTTASLIPPSELVTFIQQALPGFADGQYKLSIAQHVEDGTGAPVADETLRQTYTFAVLGDRFRFADPSAVYATFPGNADSGEYDTVLPHVVLTTPTLPWARSATATHALPPTGQDAAGDVPTWLAILLVDDADFEPFPGLSAGARDATIGDLMPRTLVSGSSLPEGGRSYFDGATDLSGLEPGETTATPIRILDLPLSLFQALAPTLGELALLAHVRRVSLVNKPTLPGISDIGQPVGDFAVVVGNRLPATGRTATAHLVSLEGLAALLPTDPPSPPGPRDAATTVRLAVLQSWSFTSTGPTAAFTDAVLALNGRDPKGPDAPVTALGLPEPSADPAVAVALQLGYVPLDHDLRDGGKTVSWYRGPLSPTVVPAPRLTTPVASADQALILDPSTGLFDASYAAAWTIGRLTALQDQAFSAGLYAWKRGLIQQVVDQAEEQVLQDGFSQAATVARPMALAAAVRPALTRSESAPIARAMHRSLLLGLHPESIR